jgi:hypothetical protein
MASIYATVAAQLNKLFKEPDGVLNSAIVRPVLEVGAQQVFSFNKVAKPTNGEVMLTFIAPVDMLFKAGLAGAVAKAGTAATAETVFGFKKNGGTNFATLTFAIDGTVGTFACAADVALAAGDILTVVAPASADATLAALTASFIGYR